MSKTALIDADIVAYRCAASAEKEEEWVAHARVDELMRRILHQTAAPDYVAYLSGQDNFRYKVNPEYKANRKNAVDPIWRESCKLWLVEQWKAKIVNGCEADDALGIDHTRLNETSVICTIDKDLLQVPGYHYNFVKEQNILISPREGLFNFYWQLIMGDRTDNIFGFDGKARASVPKFLEPLYEELYSSETEQEMFDLVRAKYNDDERLLMNGACLYIQRYEGEDWREKGRSLMVENGQKDALIPS